MLSTTAATAIRERVERAVTGSSSGPVRRAGAVILHKLDLKQYPDPVDAEPDLDDLDVALDEDRPVPTMTAVRRDRRRRRNDARRAELRRCPRTRCAGCDAVAVGFSGPRGAWHDAMPRPKPPDPRAPHRRRGVIGMSNRVVGLPSAPADWTRIITVDGTEPEIHLCSSCASASSLPAGPIHPDTVTAGSAAAELVAARAAARPPQDG